MAKKSKRPNKAKSLVAQPLFRSRQEQAKKGKGSYRREASRNWGGFFCYGGLKQPLVHPPAMPSSPTRPAYPARSPSTRPTHRQPAAHGHTIVGAQAWPHRVGRKANGSSIMIRGLDIPRGRLATLWPLQRTNQARAFDADAEAGSHVAQNEARKKKSKASSMPRGPSPIPTPGAPRGFDGAAERYGRNHWPPDGDRTYVEADGTVLANPGPYRRVQRRQTRSGRRAKVARPEDPAEESNA